MRFVSALVLLPSLGLLGACSGTNDVSVPQSDDALTNNGLAAAVKTELAKTFAKPTSPPAEYKGMLPGTGPAAADKSYENDNYVANYKVSVHGHDIYVVLGNVIDVDFELAAFDGKGVLLASGTYLGDQTAKWQWDATAQGTTHTGAPAGKKGDPCTWDTKNPRKGCAAGLFCGSAAPAVGTVCQPLLEVGEWCNYGLGSGASQTCADGLHCASDRRFSGDSGSGVCQSGKSNCEVADRGMCVTASECTTGHGSVSGNSCDGAGTVCCTK
jgi:hypothetical protein